MDLNKKIAEFEKKKDNSPPKQIDGELHQMIAIAQRYFVNVLKQLIEGGGFSKI